MKTGTFCLPKRRSLEREGGRGISWEGKLGAYLLVRACGEDE